MPRVGNDLRRRQACGQHDSDPAPPERLDRAKVQDDAVGHPHGDPGDVRFHRPEEHRQVGPDCGRAGKGVPALEHVSDPLLAACVGRPARAGRRPATRSSALLGQLELPTVAVDLPCGDHAVDRPVTEDSHGDPRRLGRWLRQAQLMSDCRRHCCRGGYRDHGSREHSPSPDPHDLPFLITTAIGAAGAGISAIAASRRPRMWSAYRRSSLLMARRAPQIRVREVDAQPELGQRPQCLTLDVADRTSQ